MTELENKMAECLLSILDTLKLADNDNLDMYSETLSEMMFRKMKGSDIDLNELLGFTHLEPISKSNYIRDNKFYTAFMEEVITNISENLDTDVEYMLQYGRSDIYGFSRDAGFGYRLYVNEQPTRCLIPVDVVQNGAINTREYEELIEMLTELLKIHI